MARNKFDVDEELEEKYDQIITSRIIGEYSPVTLTGNDIRYIRK